jgi:hypothetical protein
MNHVNCVKPRPFNLFFSLGIRAKSPGAKSDEWDGLWKTVILFSVRNVLMNIATVTKCFVMMQHSILSFPSSVTFCTFPRAVTKITIERGISYVVLWNAFIHCAKFPGNKEYKDDPPEYDHDFLRLFRPWLGWALPLTGLLLCFRTITVN